jgi:hypothetical protein
MTPLQLCTIFHAENFLAENWKNGSGNAGKIT